MNMEIENLSTYTGIHQNNLANNTTFVNGLSYHSSNIGSDFGNSRVEEITSYVRMASFFFLFFLFLKCSLPQSEHVMKFITNFFLFLFFFLSFDFRRLISYRVYHVMSQLIH